MAGVQVDRERFVARLAQASTFDLQGPQAEAIFKDLGVNPSDLGKIGDGDTVIRGDAEFAELFDKLSALDKVKPPVPGQLDRASQIYQRLVGGALIDHGTAKVGEGKATKDQKVFTERNLIVDERVKQLTALPPPAAAKGKSAEPSVQSYVEAMELREKYTRGELKLPPGRPPPGISADQWNLTASLEKQQISSSDVRYFLATGELPDLLDEHGEVVKSGADRTKELYQKAGNDGSWTAVNSITFLHGMQESSLLSEAAVFDAAAKAAPAGSDDQKALLDAAQANRDGAKASAAFRQKIYYSASIARERNADAMVSRAAKLEQDALKETDPTKAKALKENADALRKKGVEAGLAEGKYRAGIKGSLSASSAYQIAARGQIDAGNSLTRSLAIDPKATVPLDVPAPLNDAAKNADGLPGAGHILQLSRDAHQGGPKGAATDQRQLALEGNLAGAIADYHRLGADRAGYFAPPDAKGAYPARSDLAIGHRTAYLKSRVDQLNNANQRIGLYDAAQKAGTLKPGDAFEASQVIAGRAQILGELRKDVGEALAADRYATELGEQVKNAKASVDQTQAAIKDANKNLGDAQQEAKDIDPVTILDGQTDYDRDQVAVKDADTLSGLAANQVPIATKQADVAAAGVEKAEKAKGVADARATRDKDDAARVVAAINKGGILPSTTLDGVYLGLSVYGDSAAQQTEVWLQRAEAAPPKSPDAALAQKLQIARTRIDVAGYYTRSTDLEVRVYGERGRSGAEERLDTAAGLLDKADAVRGQLKPGSPDRLDLASRLVGERAALAEVSAEYRPAAPYGPVIGAYTDVQLDLGKNAAADLVGHADLHGLANAKLGSASINSMLRHKGRFLELEEQGRNRPGLDDQLYDDGQDLLLVAEAELLGAPNGPAREQGLAYVQDGATKVKLVEDALNQVDSMLRTTGEQLKNGQTYTDARTRLMARAELGATNKGASVLVRAPARKIAEWIEDDTMDAAYERKLKGYLSLSQPYTQRAINGSNDLADAFQKARDQHQALELLNSVQILAQADVRGRFGDAGWNKAYGNVRQFIKEDRRSDADWSYFMGATMREGKFGSPLAQAFRGSFTGFTAAKEMFGDPNGIVFTSDMHDTMNGQAADLKQTVDDLKWRIVVNTGLEVALVAVVTAGMGAPAAAGEGANALNTANSAVQAGNAVRTLGTLGRAVQVARGFQAAHPIIAGVITTTAIGGGMMAASHGVRKVLGANSAVADLFDLGTNFIPIGAGHKVAGVGREALQATAALEKAGIAVEKAGANSGKLRAFFGLERNLLALKHLAPTMALAGGQAAGVVAVVQYVAPDLGIKSELGQSLLGLGLNALGTGVAGAWANRNNAAHAKALTPEILKLAGQGEGSAAAKPIRTEIETFLRTTEGRVPTDGELAALSKSLQQKLGIPEFGGTPDQIKQRQDIGDLLGSIAVDRAAMVGTSKLGKGKFGEDPVKEAVALTTEALYLSRGGSEAGASRTKAEADAVFAVRQRLGDRAPAGLKAEYLRLWGGEPSPEFINKMRAEHPQLLANVDKITGKDADVIKQRALAAAEADPRVRYLMEAEGEAVAAFIGEMGGPAFQRALNSEGFIQGNFVAQLAKLPADRRAELIRAAHENPDAIASIVNFGSHSDLNLKILKEDGVDAAVAFGRASKNAATGIDMIRARGGEAELRGLLRQGPDALARAAVEAERNLFKIEGGAFIEKGAPPPPVPQLTPAAKADLARRAGVDPAVWDHPAQNPAAAKKLIQQMRSELPADVVAKLDQEALGRRFIDQADYDAAVQAGVVDPNVVYGRAAFEGWKKAAALIDGAAAKGQPLTLELLLQAHTLASEPLPNVKPGDRGRLRQPGEAPPVQGGDGLVTQDQLAALQANPDLAVMTMGEDPGSGKTRVYVSYKAENVEGRTQAVLGKMEARLAAGEDPVKVAADAQRELVSIHPFVDGNGRVSRLVMDYAMQRGGRDPAIVADPNADTHSSVGQWRDAVGAGADRIFRATQDAWAQNKGARPPVEPFRDRRAVLEDNFIAKVQSGDPARSPTLAKELFAIAGGPQLDPVTGYGAPMDLNPTVQGAIQHVQGGGEAVVVRASLRNLAGLNEKAGHSGANEHFAKLAQAVEAELAGIPGAKVSAFRDGPDVTFVVTGAKVPKETLNAALARAEQKVGAYAKANGLDQIPHPKHRDDAAWRGVGVTLVSERVRPGDSVDGINRSLGERVAMYSAVLGQSARPGARAPSNVVTQPATPSAGPPPKAPVRASGVEPFLDPTAARWKAFSAKAEANHIPQAEARALFESITGRTVDEVTGFNKAPDRVPSLEAAQAYVQKTGDNAYYVELDVSNLGGLNNAVGRDAANADFRVAGQMIKEELSAIGADVAMFRHGGDEMSAVVVGPGVKKAQVDAALAKAKARYDQYIADRGLSNLPHTKPGKAPGVSFTYGVSQVGPKEAPTDVFRRADTAVEAMKKGK